MSWRACCPHRNLLKHPARHKHQDLLPGLAQLARCSLLTALGLCGRAWLGWLPPIRSRHAYVHTMALADQASGKPYTPHPTFWAAKSARTYIALITRVLSGLKAVCESHLPLDRPDSRPTPGPRLMTTAWPRTKFLVQAAAVSAAGDAVWSQIVSPCSAQFA